MFFLKCIYSIILALFLSQSFAETKLVTYDVVNYIDRTIHQEVWGITVLRDEPGLHVVKRVLFMSSEEVFVETSTSTYSWWRQHTTVHNSSMEYTESLMGSPHFLGLKGSSFGYINVKEVGATKPTESWPLFLETGVSNQMNYAKFTVHMSGNRTSVMTRLYRLFDYFSPHAYEIKIYLPGINPNVIPHEENEGPYLEKHLIATRKDTLK